MQHEQKKYVNWFHCVAFFTFVLVYLMLGYLRPYNSLFNVMNDYYLSELLAIEKEINKSIAPFINTDGKNGWCIRSNFFGSYEVIDLDEEKKEIIEIRVIHCTHASVINHQRVETSDNLTELISTEYCPQCKRHEYNSSEFSIWQKKANSAEIKELVERRNQLHQGRMAWGDAEEWVDQFLFVPVDWLVGALYK